ncbi:hypothetical protein BV20DRAFT_115184 [Pilatotrama ljubarskyi]|nr:hypothetical protein BV20DRAFT_115184 [Pilatotrama ljubarskyi]
MARSRCREHHPHHRSRPRHKPTASLSASAADADIWMSVTDKSPNEPCTLHDARRPMRSHPCVPFIRSQHHLALLRMGGDIPKHPGMGPVRVSAPPAHPLPSTDFNGLSMKNGPLCIRPDVCRTAADVMPAVALSRSPAFVDERADSSTRLRISMCGRSGGRKPRRLAVHPVSSEIRSLL